MADKGSSSKSKSSKRKRDKTSSKKKSRRKESKKSRRIHDSPSSHSDHDSLISEHSSSSIDDKRRINKNKKRVRDYSDYSSDSDSLSDRENGVKRRKVRDSRVSSKSTKKRDRKRSVSPKAVVRKKKRLDKDRSVKSIKKSSKKKPKKYSSSDSESSRDGKSRRSRIVTDKEERGRESTYKLNKKSKVRSPSSSSISGQSDRAFSPVVNNTRRLRSVITFVVQPDDEGENRWEGDPQKEEIFYDKNDYRSPKSVDSNNACGEEVTEPIKSRIDDTNNLEKEKVSDESVPVVAALGADVLEAILRQKALENLKKFKGRLQTGPKNAELKINNETNLNKSTELISGPALKEDISRPTEVEKLPDSERMEKEAVIDEQTSTGAAILGCSEEDKCSNSRAVLAKEPVLTNDDNNPGAANPSSSSSSARLVSDEHGLEQNDEAKDGSQFKKKTMSVVRGGEVVQVSYKVYIPKKAPALARRQLKR